MLSQYGELGRVYLVPEDPLARKRRKQAGKNSGKNFTEGWVEFEDKRVAKQVRIARLTPRGLCCPSVSSLHSADQRGWVESKHTRIFEQLHVLLS